MSTEQTQCRYWLRYHYANIATYSVSAGQHKASMMMLTLRRCNAGPAGDSAADMLLDPLSFLERVSKQYGAVVGLVLGGESVILVTGGTAAQQVLMTQAAIYKKVSIFTASPLRSISGICSSKPAFSFKPNLAIAA